MDRNGLATDQTKTFESSEEEAQRAESGENLREVIRPVWEDQRLEILIYSKR
jgi:hypothetical protein